MFALTFAVLNGYCRGYFGGTFYSFLSIDNVIFLYSFTFFYDNCQQASDSTNFGWQSLEKCSIVPGFYRPLLHYLKIGLKFTRKRKRMKYGINLQRNVVMSNVLLNGFDRLIQGHSWFFTITLGKKYIRYDALIFNKDSESTGMAEVE